MDGSVWREDVMREGEWGASDISLPVILHHLLMRALIISHGGYVRNPCLAFRGNAVNSWWHQRLQGEHWEHLDAQIKWWRDEKVHGWISRGWKQRTIGQSEPWSEARKGRRMNRQSLEGLASDYHGTQVWRCELAANIPHLWFQKCPESQGSADSRDVSNEWCCE